MAAASTLDIQKIKTTVSSLENTERVIVDGSDEHLDVILRIRDNLKNSTTAIRELVDGIENAFNSISAENADSIIVTIFPCFEIARRIRADIVGFGFIGGVTACLEEFEGEMEQLSEIINDLARHKSSSAEGDENYF